MASICDQVRAVFPNAQLIHGEEGGREIGKHPADPSNWATVDLMKSPSLFEVACAAGRARK